MTVVWIKVTAKANQDKLLTQFGCYMADSLLSTLRHYVITKMASHDIPTSKVLIISSVQMKKQS